MMNQRGQAPIRGQGTIEYLVIIAIVIVIGLTVAGLSTNILSANSAQVGNTSGKIAGKVGSGGISITESVTDARGDAIISLINNSGGNLTLIKITPLDSKGNAGTASNFNTTIVQGSSRTFSLSDLNTSCPCNPGDTVKTCTFRFTITADSGLQQTLTTSVTTTCSTDTTPTNPGGVVGLGSGTLADPWIINSCSELQNMNQHLDGNYSLGVDLDCSETRNWNAGAGFVPVGSRTSSYTGTFTGNNRTISGLYINRVADYLGLFGATTAATISNTILVDVNISGVNYVGSLLGAQGVGTISNSYSTGTVTGSTQYIGGLVGYTNGTISSSHSTARVKGSASVVGGLVGESEGTITSSYSTGDVNGDRSIGGLVGWQNSGTISMSYSTGNVTGASVQAGGLVGNTSGLILSSFATGTVTGVDYVGGLSGYTNGTIINSYATGRANSFSSLVVVGGLVGVSDGDITNSYATGDANGYGSIGGLVGSQASKTITNSYAVGLVTGIGSSKLGGLVGNKVGTIITSYWNKPTGSPLNCYNGGNTNCTAIDNNIPYFYYQVAPLASWGTWTNTSGSKYSTSDGNWSICRGASLPWLTWEGRSC